METHIKNQKTKNQKHIPKKPKKQKTKIINSVNNRIVIGMPTHKINKDEDKPDLKN
jgi:hypothetical protein